MFQFSSFHSNLVSTNVMWSSQMRLLVNFSTLLSVRLSFQRSSTPSKVIATQRSLTPSARFLTSRTTSLSKLATKLWIKLLSRNKKSSLLSNKQMLRTASQKLSSPSSSRSRFLIHSSLVPRVSLCKTSQRLCPVVREMLLEDKRQHQRERVLKIFHVISQALMLQCHQTRLSSLATHLSQLLTLAMSS